MTNLAYFNCRLQQWQWLGVCCCCRNTQLFNRGHARRHNLWHQRAPLLPEKHSTNWTISPVLPRKFLGILRIIVLKMQNVIFLNVKVNLGDWWEAINQRVWRMWSLAQYTSICPFLPAYCTPLFEFCANLDTASPSLNHIYMLEWQGTWW